MYLCCGYSNKIHGWGLGFGVWGLGFGPEPSTSITVVEEPAALAVVRAPASHVGPPVAYTGTTEHIESSGMIIDCDFM